MSSRRKFLTGSFGAVAGAIATSTSWAADAIGQPCPTRVASLCGEWLFRTDPEDRGTKSQWYGVVPREGWRSVTVPHTWQVEAPLADYRGVAWYWRPFDLSAIDAPASWRDCAVRVEFEAVFHTATVWVNGELAGEHARKGYTAFTLDITHLLHWDRTNTIAVRVDNAFNQHMVPRGRSSDWANDGGIFRPVQLLVTPKVFVERVDVDAVPDLSSGDGKLAITAHIRNTSEKPWSGKASFLIAEEEGPLTLLSNTPGKAVSVGTGTVETLSLQASPRPGCGILTIRTCTGSSLPFRMEAPNTVSAPSLACASWKFEMAHSTSTASACD